MNSLLEKELFSPDFLNENPELLKINEIKIDVDDKLQQALVEYDSIKKQIGEIKTESVLESCKESVLSNLYSKFGVNRLVAMEDKDGGNVTTLNNFKKGITATESDDARYQNYQNHMKEINEGRWTIHNKRDEFGNIIYNESGNPVKEPGLRQKLGYDKRNKELKERFYQNGTAIDEYTGLPLAKEDANIDHGRAAITIEKDPRTHLFQTDEQRVAMATNDKNMILTDASLNKSKNDKDMKSYCTDEEKVKEHHVDKKKALARDKKAVNYINRTITKDEIKKYSKEVVGTGLSTGGKTFLYSAIGQISSEFIKAVFDALIEAFKERHTKSLKEILDSFKLHIEKAVEHIKANWKEILANSFEGALMNFLNNLLVFAINLVATTLKNVVSMIRAGFTTVCSAVKLLCNPPKDMTEDERNDAVAKILIFGMTEVSAIALNECVENLLVTLGVPKNISEVLVYPLTAFMGGIVASIILGIMQNARNESKKSKLNVVLVAQSNVVVQAQIVQNWCLLSEGVYKLKEKSESFDRTMKSVDSSLKASAEQSEKALNEIDDIISELKR